MPKRCKSSGKNPKHEHRAEIEREHCAGGSLHAATDGNPDNRQEKQIEQLVALREVRTKDDEKSQAYAAGLRQRLRRAAHASGSRLRRQRR